MITDKVKVLAGGQEVTRIAREDGTVLLELSAEVENGDKYVKPSGTLPITTNGTHNVAGYETAEVQVSASAPTYDTPVISVSEDKTRVRATANGKTGERSLTDLGLQVAGTASGEGFTSAEWHSYLVEEPKTIGVATQEANIDLGADFSGYMIVTFESDNAPLEGTVTVTSLYMLVDHGTDFNGYRRYFNSLTATGPVVPFETGNQAVINNRQTHMRVENGIFRWVSLGNTIYVGANTTIRWAAMPIDMKTMVYLGGNS